MKNVLCFFMLLMQSSYSQHSFLGVVEYTIESAEAVDSLKINRLNNQLGLSESDKRSIKTIINQPAYFVLHFNGQESSYRNKNQESLEVDDNIKKLPNFLLNFGGGRNCNYYTSIKDNKTFAEKIVFGEFMTIIYELPKWEITSELKVIGNLVCRKAIKKAGDSYVNNLEVWFCSDIPVQFGPQLYNGLPGLVIEVISSNVRIIASRVDLKPNVDLSISKPTKSRIISEEDYGKLVEKMAKELGF
jgi:GLPGLI family protein